MTFRAAAGFAYWIKSKFTGGYHAAHFLFCVTVSLTVLLFLMCKFWVSASKLIVGDIAVYVFFKQVFYIGFVCKAGVGGDDYVCS